MEFVWINEDRICMIASGRIDKINYISSNKTKRFRKRKGPQTKCGQKTRPRHEAKRNAVHSPSPLRQSRIAPQPRRTVVSTTSGEDAIGSLATDLQSLSRASWALERSSDAYIVSSFLTLVKKTATSENPHLLFF
jgi:hypothetical protein